ncbi:MULTISPECIES: hypothetical protein [Kocuria]|uniref:Uncharacterized protein n=1 Tax=Kocuria subflava TaxID=1736139 RepID=A0A846TRZ4_9MICC|nr:MULTISPECIES: hypothetical protein [Kocuria]NKE08604.1 hypothetical protein [Kocuria subflava]
MPTESPVESTPAEHAGGRESTQSSSVVFTDRRGTVVQKVVPVLAPVMPLVLAAWLVLASVPLGGPGGRALIWLGVLAAPLGVLLWISGALVLAERAYHRPAYARPVTTVLIVCAWVGAVVLGFFLPDLIDGRGQSLFTAAAGPDSVGLSAGFANTLGVLTFAAAAGSVVSAALDVRSTKARLRGDVVELDPEEEDRLRQQWVNSFQDPADFAREYGDPR